MTATPPPLPLPVCPGCGGVTLTFDYAALVTVTMAAGAVTCVTVSGVLDALPDGLLCADCQAGADAGACPEPTGQAAAERIDAALPPRLRRGLHDGITLYAREPHPGSLPLVVRV